MSQLGSRAIWTTSNRDSTVSNGVGKQPKARRTVDRGAPEANVAAAAVSGNSPNIRVRTVMSSGAADAYAQ
jgi:hypothetical protein